MEGLSQFRLPPLPCSFPLAELHPMYEALKKDIDAFCIRSAETTDERELAFIVAEKWPFLTCAFWPTALDSRLPWVTKFMCWFILLDTKADNMDSLGGNRRRTEALMHKYIAVIQQGGQNGNATGSGSDAVAECDESMFLSVFVSLWEQFKADATPTQYARLSDRMCTLFNLTIQQSKLRDEGVVLSTHKLLELKRVVGLGMACVPLMEYAAGIELDEHILNRPEIQEMELACVDHMVTVNDILSFRKEYLGRDFNNLPSSFCLSEGVDLQTAVHLTWELVRDADRKLNDLYASISKADYCTPEVTAFMDGLGYMTSGAVEWSWHSARYHGLNWVIPPTNEREGVMYLEDPPRFEFKPSNNIPPTVKVASLAF